jgi:hypothetical protein
MNCLEFRRLVDTDPDSKDEDFVRHKAQCESCARLASRAARFSSALTAAARVEAPENLTSRVLLRQSFSDSRTLLSRRSALAAAASITIVAGLAVAGAYFLRREDPLAREIFARIRQADDSFRSKTLLDSRAVAEALAPVGLDVTGELGKITYAGQSILQGKLSGHLVIQGEWAPCTVFLIPEVRVANEYTIRADHMKGVVVPFDEGAMAIVGAPEESLAPVVERVKTAFRWRHA